MCGIAGIHLLDTRLADKLDVEKLAAELLRGIEGRGQDATGFAAVDMDGRVTVQKAAVRAGTFLTYWRGIENGATRTVLLHTRYATQGSPDWPENNHPVRWGPLHVVHNGTVQNDDDVFTRAGKRRNGTVDSEAIPAVIAEAGWTNARTGLETLDGSFAIAAVSEDHPGEVLLARAGWSPLVWSTNGKLLVWASTEAALRDAWRKAVGTPPKWKKVNHAPEGTILRVADREIHKGTFVPYQPPRKPVPSAPLKVGRVTGADWRGWDTCQVGADRIDPRANERRYGFGFMPSAPSPAAQVEVEVELERCACCHEWTDVQTMEQAYGEDCCPACHSILTEEIERTTEARRPRWTVNL